MSPVAEVIKEVGGLLVGAATLATSIAALVSTMRTKKLVDGRTAQLLEGAEYKGRAKALEEAKAGESATRREVLEVAKEIASVSTPASTKKIEEP
jgi:hypothetical protein